jgi:3-phytase
MRPSIRRPASLVTALLLGAVACAPSDGDPAASSGAETAGAPLVALPLVADTLEPAVITDSVKVDSDDPAIWVHPTDPASSLLLGTDKGDTDGGVYVFTLDGRIDRQRSVTPLQRMNNVDVAQRVVIGGDTLDIAVATERNRQMLRVFSLPDMQAIDGGGIPVFDGDTTRAPMGVSLYRRPSDGAVFAIVGGKSGPTDGSYLWQYRLVRGDDGVVRGERVRAFGTFSGTKEIEAITVDDALGYVYFSDEGVGVRKYFAEPDSGNRELALFAMTGVVEDHEGLAIYETGPGAGYLLLSDQQGQRVQVFAREGTAGDPHRHEVLAVIPVRATETDGLEVTSMPLGARFPEGVLVMMTNTARFHVYDWRDVARAIATAREAAGAR